MAAFLDGRLGFLDIAAVVEDALATVDGAPARNLAELREADAEARRIVAGSSRTGMNVTIAILGLALLILVHEAGHFFTARAVGMSPRRFYLGFPPALVKVRRKDIEYGIGAIPLGGYVKIPGMHRPAPSDLDVHFGRAREESPSLNGTVERIKRLVAAGEWREARAQLPELERAVRDADLSPAAAKAAERGLERAPRRARAGRLLAPDDLAQGGGDLRRARHEPRFRDPADRARLHGRRPVRGVADGRPRRPGVSRAGGGAQVGRRDRRRERPERVGLRRALAADPCQRGPADRGQRARAATMSSCSSPGERGWPKTGAGCSASARTSSTAATARSSRSISPSGRAGG